MAGKKNKKNVKSNKNYSKKTVKKGRFFDTLLEFVKKHFIAIIAVFVAVVIVGVTVFTVVSLNIKIPNSVALEYSGENETPSTVSTMGINEEQQLKKYNGIKRKIHGKKSKFKFYANDYIEIDELFLEGTVAFGNLSTNDCTLIMSIVDEEDDVIYSSRGIMPGKYLPRISLVKDIAFGVHECKMYVVAFNSVTYEYIGTQQMDVTVVMGTEYGEDS